MPLLDPERCHEALRSFRMRLACKSPALGGRIFPHFGAEFA